MLGAMLDDNWFPDGERTTSSTRTQTTFSSSSTFTPERLLYKEATFYNLLDHVRAAKF
ncbi:hypothetical protein QJS10_CPA03g00623 [Acorus calamus]|uniref:Uncharacterized protein n=1 Tax=Acorus calamus TaxID=4465 RepID=A0AAV9F2H5_ACOCL|nr:hypothetical protein QJS10_CPA03g00623 [Acorus calamus]